MGIQYYNIFRAFESYFRYIPTIQWLYVNSIVLKMNENVYRASSYIYIFYFYRVLCL